MRNIAHLTFYSVYSRSTLLVLRMQVFLSIARSRLPIGVSAMRTCSRGENQGLLLKKLHIEVKADAC